MASKCPKCHQVVEDDAVCCADLQYTWKCKSCSKLTQGFVIPYGRCFMCGGENEVVKGYEADDPTKTRAIEEAVRYEVEMYTFYRLASERTQSETLKPVLQELYLKEEDHLRELDEKYHVHLDDQIRKLPQAVDEELSAWLFKDIAFDDASHVTKIYDQAIEMERRTRDYFKARADALPAGTEKDIFSELAAEEEEHVAMLESERAHVEG